MVKKKRNTHNQTLFAVVLSIIVTNAALFGSVSVSILSPEAQIIGSLLFGVIVFYLLKLSIASMQSQQAVGKPLIRFLAVAVLSALTISATTAINSFWISPFADSYPDRFVLENMSVGFSLGAIIGACILSFLQKDLFWAGSKETAQFDERQIKERQQVFEVSYRVGAFALALIAWFISANLDAIPAIMANHHGTIPGHFGFVALNVVTFFFALPLFVGAFKRK